MNKQYAFYIDAERCIGCFTCAMACKNQYHQPETVVWRQVYPIKKEIYPHRERAFYSLACNHCENPTCLNVCPVVAYTKRDADGIVVHEQEKCIGCGNCLLHCPVYDTIAIDYGRSPALGGRGVGMLAVTEGLDEAVDRGLYLCTQCQLCEDACPAAVGAPAIIETLRRRAYREGKMVEPARVIMEVIKEHGTPYGEDLGDLPEPPGRADTVVYVGCQERRSGDPDLPAARRILDRLGIDHAFVDERCCQALTALLGGDRDPEAIEHNRRAIIAAGAQRVVTLCPTCAHWLERDLEGTGIQVMPFIELIARADLPASHEGVVTYHDPCDLGRKSGHGTMGFDAPRRAIEATGATLREMPRSREESKCCGGGGGLRATYPALSVAMAKERMQEIRGTGAEYCLTDCPSCVHNLSNALKRKDGVRIMTTTRWLDHILEEGAT